MLRGFGPPCPLWSPRHSRLSCQRPAGFAGGLETASLVLQPSLGTRRWPGSTSEAPAGPEPSLARPAGLQPAASASGPCALLPHGLQVGSPQHPNVLSSPERLPFPYPSRTPATKGGCLWARTAGRSCLRRPPLPWLLVTRGQCWEITPHLNGPARSACGTSSGSQLGLGLCPEGKSSGPGEARGSCTGPCGSWATRPVRPPPQLFWAGCPSGARPIAQDQRLGPTCPSPAQSPSARGKEAAPPPGRGEGEALRRKPGGGGGGGSRTGRAWGRAGDWAQRAPGAATGGGAKMAARVARLSGLSTGPQLPSSLALPQALGSHVGGTLSMARPQPAARPCWAWHHGAFPSPGRPAPIHSDSRGATVSASFMAPPEGAAWAGRGGRPHTPFAEPGDQLLVGLTP